MHSSAVVWPEKIIYFDHKVAFLGESVDEISRFKTHMFATFV